MSGADLAAAALTLVGSRFRLGGREPATGLDCLGVLAAALAAIGRPAELPACRTLHRRGPIAAEAFAGAAGLVPASGGINAGDVVLVRCSPVQPHLMIAIGGERFVHAHAGLARVVVSPRDPAWPIAAHWRLPEIV